jgi:hypothetical protein
MTIRRRAAVPPAPLRARRQRCVRASARGAPPCFVGGVGGTARGEDARRSVLGADGCSHASFGRPVQRQAGMRAGGQAGRQAGRQVASQPASQPAMRPHTRTHAAQRAHASPQAPSARGRGALRRRSRRMPAVPVSPRACAARYALLPDVQRPLPSPPLSARKLP